jgi:hypothetical protein
MQGHFRDVIAQPEAKRDRNGPVNGRVNGCHRIRVPKTASGISTCLLRWRNALGDIKWGCRKGLDPEVIMQKDG